MAKRKNSQIYKIENLNLNANEIEEILDSASIADDIFDYIAERYKDKLADDSFKRIDDLLQLKDLTKIDEQYINTSLSQAAKRSFCNLMIAGKLSRLEIIYFVKNNLVNENDLDLIFEKMVSTDLMIILLRWKPEFLDKLQKYWSKYNITEEDVRIAKQKSFALEKFLYLSSNETR